MLFIFLSVKDLIIKFIEEIEKKKIFLLLNCCSVDNLIIN